MHPAEAVPIRVFFVTSPMVLLWMLAHRRGKKEKIKEAFVAVGIGPNSYQERENLAKFMSVVLEHEPLRFTELDSETDHVFSVFDLRSIAMERRRKRRVLTELEGFLETNGIDRKNVSEIWYSQVRSASYLKFSNRKSKLYLFEHGVGDPPNVFASLFPADSLRLFLKRIKQWLRGRLVYFDSISPSADFFPTVFADPLRRISKTSVRGRILDLAITDIKAAALGIGITGYRGGRATEKRVLLLLPNVSGLGLSEEKESRFFQRILEWVRSDVDTRFGVGTRIYFKSRADFLVRYEKSIHQLKKNSLDQSFIRFEEEFGEVPLLEPFLEKECFLGIYAGFSSALFYAGIFDPKIIRISIHEVVSVFLREIDESVIPDYRWLDEFYFRRFAHEFARWLPIRAGVAATVLPEMDGNVVTDSDSSS